VAIACFGTYILLNPDIPLTPKKAFVSLSLLRLVRQPVNWLRVVFMAVKKIWISGIRIHDFLGAEEITEARLVTDGRLMQEIVVHVCDASFAWSSISGSPVMVDIKDLNVKRGSLVAVVGQTGDGKSSFISALLGEMFKVGGTVEVHGKTAYVSQQAWIISGSIRDNIIFGKPWNEKLYHEVVDGCALLRDFDQFPAGDRTEIGTHIICSKKK
jgi:ABC-type multidrug transport system fused ATPase/permease subunit